MAQYEGGDCDLDPETGVLRNRLGITDEQRLAPAEASLVAWRSDELSQKPLAGDFDLAHLQAIHCHRFGDVYDWAGEIRTIDRAKGNTYFAHHPYIVSASRPIFEPLKKERSLQGLNPAEFSEQAAYYLGEINALHPFREGNGRAQREFINPLAWASGYTIDWSAIHPDELMQASIESFHGGETTPLAKLIKANLQDR